MSPVFDRTKETTEMLLVGQDHWERQLVAFRLHTKIECSLRASRRLRTAPSLGMSIKLPPFDDRLRQAVAQYWTTLDSQAKKQSSGSIVDHGRRVAVTGGKQMMGFCELVHWLLVENGLDTASIYFKSRRELPGFFRATKDWDLLVVHGGCLVAALEFKSQKGSFGNNFNNRTEEALGNATDLSTAFRDGAFGQGCPRPWLGWVMLLEESEKSTRPVRLKEPHFKVFPEFRNTSYVARYQILMRKLVLEKLYDSAAFLLSTEKGGRRGEYSSPAEDLTMKRLLGSLLGHVGGYLAAVK